MFEGHGCGLQGAGSSVFLKQALTKHSLSSQAAWADACPSLTEVRLFGTGIRMNQQLQLVNALVQKKVYLHARLMSRLSLTAIADGRRGPG
jgi:hypothetical protein